ncbi:phosphoribosylglycinamide formyltransferase [Arcanobacterium hippocoleae]|uniref:Phosphoribosylglycinamide formyltransferase n=2 Tax=Arcanobacterium hippocoleae TaxID=149017 RepID=A0ABU1T0F0_9ACTO|nr:phosphoribosylglycinamide formyltransferase-1 [Arcanobacterium hippocoleae]
MKDARWILMTAAKARVAVLISGGGTNLQAIIDAVSAGNLPHVELSCVISNKADAYGIKRAQAAKIPVHVLENVPNAQGKKACEAQILQILHENRIQLVALAGFMAILSADFIAQCPAPIINIHPSLIPAFSGPGYYGLRVHEAALAAGVKVSGATVHFVNEICDGGKILAQDTVRVQELDTPQSLQQRILHEVEHVIFPRTIEALCAEIVNRK